MRNIRYFLILNFIVLLSGLHPVTGQVNTKILTSPALRMNVAHALAITGYYRGNDGGHYYIRQEGSTVYWFGEAANGGWANAMKGTLNGNTIEGQWFDLPKGGARGKGAITLIVSDDRKTLTRSSVTGGFGGTQWTSDQTPSSLPGKKTGGFHANGNLNDLSGVWTGNDNGVYYLRQDGTTVIWFGEQDYTSGVPGFANVAFGTRNGNDIYLEWMDVAKCKLGGKGNLRLRVDNANQIVKVEGAGFGGSQWTRPGAVADARFTTAGRTMMNTTMTTAAVRNIKMADIYSKQYAINPNGLVLVPTRPKPEETPKPEDMGTTVQGPNLAASEDIDVVFADPSFNYFTEKLNLYRKLYEDLNPKSGYFYYLPANYNLDWNRETGEYAFKIYYLSSSGDGRGSVIVTAQLTPSIKREDLEYAEQYLSKKFKKTVRLVPMPLRDTPKISFGSFLSLFDVDESSLHPSIPTDFLQPIVVSWRMNSRVEDLVGAMMENFGVNGNLEFNPYSEENQNNISVPAKLKINDTGTYGKMEYTDAAALLNGFYNSMDYPVVLSSLIVLRENADKSFTVDYIPLKNYQVEPQMLFSSFDPNERSRVLGGGLIKKMWLNYSVKPCSNCNMAVQQKIMGGTSSNRIQRIEIEALTPLASSGASSMKVLIKSKQGDPKGVSEVILPIVKISTDNQTYSGGELFVKEGEAPNFEYRLVLIMPNGEEVLSEWIPRQELFLVIGENTIRDHLSTQNR